MSAFARPHLGLARLAGALALTSGLAPAALAQGEARWQLVANVPVICAVIDVTQTAEPAASLTIATTCNTERYQLVLSNNAGEAALRAARSSGGAVQISGSIVTITSSRPGQAVTTIELAAPVRPGQFAVTLQPL